MTTHGTSLGVDLAETIVDRVEQLILEAERQTRPLEVDPFHAQLFELFVMSDAVERLDDDPESKLSADTICRELARRWGLADATRNSLEQQTQIPPQHLARMRMLWSVMRMWIEWTYAWRRYDEFHQDQTSNQD